MEEALATREGKGQEWQFPQTWFQTNHSQHVLTKKTISDHRSRIPYWVPFQSVHKTGCSVCGHLHVQQFSTYPSQWWTRNRDVHTQQIGKGIEHIPGWPALIYFVMQMRICISVCYLDHWNVYISVYDTSHCQEGPGARFHCISFAYCFLLAEPFTFCSIWHVWK